MIFESHAHYDDEDFDADREELLSSLAAHGIGTVVNIGASLAGSEATVKLAEQYPFIYGAVGVHPSEVEELSEEGMERLRAWCSHEKIVAVGETGLDYHYPERRRRIRWTSCRRIARGRSAAWCTVFLMRRRWRGNI